MIGYGHSGFNGDGFENNAQANHSYPQENNDQRYAQPLMYDNQQVPSSNISNQQPYRNNGNNNEGENRFTQR